MIEMVQENYSPGSQVRKITQNITFKNALLILEKNFGERNIKMEYYALKLFMLQRNLNFICYNVLNMGITEIIEDRKIVERKNLLIPSENHNSFPIFFTRN